MEISDIKNYVYENNLTEMVLEEIGCRNIKRHQSGENHYITCSNFDGDNPSAITIYLNPYLNVINYTRDLSDSYGKCDIINLIMYNKKMYLYHAVKWLCDLVGLNYYNDDAEEIPESLKWLREMNSLKEGKNLEEDIPLKPIDEKILDYFIKEPNDIFEKDNISLRTQREFEVGFDLGSGRITIPIRDEQGTLVGVKGRLYKKEPDDYNPKYMYLEPCSKAQILYGLYKTLPYILTSGRVYVLESEKAVMQLWSNGICNAVSIGSHKLSRKQVQKLTRLNVEVIICYDKDVDKKNLIEEKNKFLDGVKTKIMFDEDNILNEKESPSDNINNFKYMVEHNIYEK